MATGQDTIYANEFFYIINETSDGYELSFGDGAIVLMALPEYINWSGASIRSGPAG